MRVLLDTHILLWALSNDCRLPKEAKRIIDNENNEVYYSILSIWEVENKHILHPTEMQFNGKDIIHFCKESKFIKLILKEEHIIELSNLKREENAPRHKDPFDRMLICQAISENIFLVTHDKLLQYYQCDNVFLV